ncbi:hypothetical protein [Cytophaga hutchinsonii]|jgi:hypothetical protein|uniref:Uncharacterized protein n=1 Tax=Cytophaga hutchinsonii (strain ATCC 33406 / DSM 1761 / CIP 103989 / NBRC 15051 / NCIMB 9469 / D465) TaxID=269798 RepID=A0A6N4SQ58_CYTH3|nr:hypothetical protein [Cytophaga hutchinsonii]ABG58462.1 hypothetical protein CHU_1187 [Cytophaga hutchinsonii ATCC 33406]SFX74936.1 hypothetical protein SAMN04487930_10928 [Cytophaga hutchinsonii ATCC 33406]
MNVVQRVKSPTPKFFKVLRTIGLSLAAAGTTIIASPIAVPIAVVSIASYVIVAGAVLTAVSQTAVESTKQDEPNTEQ